MRKYFIPTAFTEERISADYQGDMTLLNQIFAAALLAEPTVGGPLTKWTGDYFGNARMAKAEALAIWNVTPEVPIANIAAGDPNPFFRFIDSVDKSGNGITRNVDVSVMQTINDDDYAWFPTLDRLYLLAAIGGDTEGFEVFLQANPDDEVPVGVPDRTYLDENDQEVVKTWLQWAHPAHQTDFPHAKPDGNHYVAFVLAATAQYAPLSYWFPLVTAGTITLLTKQQYLAILNQAIPE